ncbi:MAG: linear amide C-N hydrolase [Elusimicrobia bacterium]|nr:linear amide C-N hydrolase [Elusimicrobiota bacterium]
MNRYKNCMFGMLLACVLSLSGADARACSRVLYAGNGQAVLNGRNMDWPDAFNGTDMWLLPRGMKRDGFATGKSLEWTAKYASLVAVSYMAPGKGAVADGINEKGLAANLLWLADSDYGRRDQSVPGLSIAVWTQYVLDNFSTVEEAVAVLANPPYQIDTRSIIANGAVLKANLHLALADKTGDSAIVEYAGGKPVIHHARKYAVMANDPILDRQLENLKRYQGFGGKKPLPGTISPADRFVRGSYYLSKLPKPATYRQALAGLFSVMRNMAQPFSTVADPEHPNSSATQWTTVGDITNGTYYFASATSPFLLWAGFGGFKLDEINSPMKLDMSGDRDLGGDMSAKFVPSRQFDFMPVADKK